jgi:dihydroorotate dehydrogenase (fumarate)
MTISVATSYLGLELPSPLVVGAAAPLSTDLQHLRELEREGAGAVVLHSLFLEQIERDWQEWIHHQQHSSESHPEALSYLPAVDPQHLGLEGYLEEIRRAREALSIPVIASLNGSHSGHWREAAVAMEQAGAHAIELNLYAVSCDIHRSSAELEAEQLAIVQHVCSAVTVPVAVKLSPFYTSLAAMAAGFQQAGAGALVLFNRFLQPLVDIDTLDTDVHLQLSHPEEQRLPLRWIALLHGRVPVDLAASGGVHRGSDVVRLLMAGARITQVVGALLRHGPERLAGLEEELASWLMEHEVASVAELIGCMSQQRCPNPAEYERAQYMRAIQGYRPADARQARGPW